ncbi:MAG: hypothetical protein ABIQ27_04995 [Flavobacterium sp.]
MFLIKRKSQKKTFGITLNEVNIYLNDVNLNKHNLNKNKNLEELHQIFGRRYSIYEIDQVQEVFANEIKTAFNKIDISEFPTNYTYTKFIQEIAIIEVINEILRLLSINSQLLEMFYKLNEFNEFEIKYHRNISLENYPVYKKMHIKLYPEYYTNFTKNEDLEAMFQSNARNIENDNFFASLFINSDVYNCFLEYQKHIIDFYIDYSYLKKRLESEKLIHYHKDNDFIKFVFEDIKLISKKNYDEYYINGKLKSLAKSFSVQRQNNFNLVFKDLL